MSEINKLKPFKLWVLQNFPFIEADFDALTNYEMMCKIVGKLNEVVDLTNEQTNVINTLNSEFTELYNYVHQYIFDVDELKEAIALINNRLDEIAEQVLLNTNNIALLNNKIDTNIENLRVDLTALINQNYNTLKDYVDYQDSQLNEKIDNIQIGQIQIYDPTSGTIKPLQDVINDLYALTNKDGLTAGEFDALELTASAFDAYEITAYEFDSSGKTILI